MNSKILILGGNGLVGSSFDYGKKITRKDADLTDLQEVISLIEREKPTWVINCAGYVGGVKANMDYKFDFFKDNILINLNVIEACMQCSVPNVISFLSTCIFPDQIARLQPLKEEDLHEGEPHPSNYPYAYAKRMIDVLSRIGRDLGYNYSCIVPTNIYGKNDNYHLEKSHIVPALIRKFHSAYSEAKRTGKEQVVEVWGSGKPLREFIYADDIPKVVKYIIENDIRFDNLIFSTSVSHNIHKIAHTINEIFKKKYKTMDFDDEKGIYEKDLRVTFEFNTSKPDGQFAKTTSSNKFKSLIPIKLTELEEGLEETIDYFINTYENNRELLRL